MVEELLLSGADIVKVGIGSGSVCTTRVKAGVGYPQLSAVIECADAAHGLGGRIISDGGCTCPGDIAKAFGGGADFVMIGGMFAGHDESDGEMVERAGKRYKKFYGMSSETAMGMHSGGVAEYRAAEGKSVEVPYRGPIAETVREILGGVRSACTYVGAMALRELTKRTTFIRVQEQENRTFSATPGKMDR
jgi:GMP reductase